MPVSEQVEVQNRPEFEIDPAELDIPLAPPLDIPTLFSELNATAAKIEAAAKNAALQVSLPKEKKKAVVPVERLELFNELLVKANMRNAKNKTTQPENIESRAPIVDKTPPKKTLPIPAPVADTNQKVWKQTKEGEQLPNCEVTPIQQIMIARAAVNQSDLVRETVAVKKAQFKESLQSWENAYEQCQPLQFKTALYLQLNQILLGGYLKASYGELNKKIRFEESEARNINRILMDVSDKDPKVFCQSIELLSKTMIDKLAAEIFADKSKIETAEQVIQAVKIWNEKLHQLFSKGVYLLPKKDVKEKYVAALALNLITELTRDVRKPGLFNAASQDTWYLPSGEEIAEARRLEEERLRVGKGIGASLYEYACSIGKYFSYVR